MNDQEAPNQFEGVQQPSSLLEEFSRDDVERIKLHTCLEDLLLAIEELVDVGPPGSHPEYMKTVEAFNYRYNAEIRIVRYLQHPESKEATLYFLQRDEGSAEARPVTHIHVKRGEDGALSAEQMLVFHGHGTAIGDARRERNALHEAGYVETPALESRHVQSTDVEVMIETLKSSAVM